MHAIEGSVVMAATVRKPKSLTVYFIVEFDKDFDAFGGWKEGKIIPVVLKRDKEKVNPSLFFYKEITSHAGGIEILKPGTYTLQLKNFDVDADKWTKGFGLDRIELMKN